MAADGSGAVLRRRVSFRRKMENVRGHGYTAVLLPSAPTLQDIPELRTASGRTVSQPSEESLQRALELLEARVQRYMDGLEEYLSLSAPTPDARNEHEAANVIQSESREDYLRVEE